MTGNNHPLLSICCLGYNHEKFLSENIQSIIDIKYNNIEVIVVDDGSKDNSIEELTKLAEKVPFQMKIISQQNTGNIGKNFNNAYKQARGELITFISLDDVYNAKVMRKQIYMMIENSNIGFITSSKAVSINHSGYINEEFSKLPIHNNENLHIHELLELEFSEFGAFYIQGTIFRKSIVDAVNAFDEDMTGDDIILRTKVLRYMIDNPIYSFEVMKDNSCYYRLHDNNIHKNTRRQIKIVTEYLEKYWEDRKNPDVLIYWVNAYISNHKFSEYISLFALNKRASSLLLEVRVQKKIKRSIEKERLENLFKYIYKKEKFTSGMRKICLFNFIRLSYSRTKKYGIGPHYSDIKD
ncbi:glycosyltransferase family 2 protein [Pectobacterium sp. LFLA-215]|uniref:glycosyltransferase family 2 protein n=1 Tax=Pectobacterium sp. LFLA-215 TaxID=3419008 RepID=UPI003F5B46CD